MPCSDPWTWKLAGAKCRALPSITSSSSSLNICTCAFYLLQLQSNKTPPSPQFAWPVASVLFIGCSPGLVKGVEKNHTYPRSSPPLHLPKPPQNGKGAQFFYSTHFLCVNKCLQFYIKDWIKVRSSECIFFTFYRF